MVRTGENFQQHGAVLTRAKSFATLQREYRHELKAEAERRKRQADVRKDIADLPQLFIAA
jgi:hypothetical protein